MGLSWMAWTWPTASFFIGIATLISIMIIVEKRHPGGNPRHGVFGLDTTRGDRLFISILSAGIIHLAWLGFFGTPLWGAVVISLLFAVFVFKYV